MKTIGIITYNTNHLKTEQILSRISGKYSLKVYALPYVARKPREVLFQHRPNQSVAAHPADLCAAYGIPFVPVNSDAEIDNGCDLYLITGAGILSPECVRGKRILNCHPGVIPAVRGLDAFKWAIINGLPIGNTLHYIDEGVDQGEVVAVLKTPLYPSDSLESFARRHYELEIDMMSAFSEHLANPQNDFPTISERESTRRMPAAVEAQIFSAFEVYKQKYAPTKG